MSFETNELSAQFQEYWKSIKWVEYIPENIEYVTNIILEEIFCDCRCFKWQYKSVER